MNILHGHLVTYLLSTSFSVDFSVILNVETPVVTVTEMEQGATETVNLCFSAQINRTLNRNATFNFLLTNYTTANVSTDFISAYPSYITFTAGSSGNMSCCIDVVVIGDSLVENNETIVYDIVPVYDLDRVLPAGSPAVTINVIDDDGKWICTNKPGK